MQERAKRKATNYCFYFNSEILNKGDPRKVFQHRHLSFEPLSQPITIGFTDLGNIIRVIFSHG